MMDSIQQCVSGKFKGLLLLLPLILTLALSGAVLNHYSQHPAAGFPLGITRSNYETLPAVRSGSAYPYD